MKRFLGATWLCLFACLCARAQHGRDYYPTFEQLRGDYRQVALVAHVKVRSIKLAAPGPHDLYAAEASVVEPLKGRLRRGQTLRFYMAFEEGVKTDRWLGDWVVFLEGSSNSPDGRWSWFTLENSSLPYSEVIIAEMRKVRRLARRKVKPRYGRAAARTGR